MSTDSIVAIGASAGGVRALQLLASQLPPAFPAAILVVQHIGSNASTLPSLLSRAGPLPAVHAADGEMLMPACIYVAPPDRHMLIDGGRIRHSHGPREHHTRPAIDPLFRSVAVSAGPRAVGIVLTGMLDDGTAGLQAIKACGGTAVVQDPSDAEAPSMPLSALRYVEVDHVVPLARMGSLLSSLVATPRPPAHLHGAPWIVHENEIMLGKGDFMEHLREIGKPSSYVCPDCAGGLWEVAGQKPKRYRCHTGHAFTLRTLQHAQSEATDDALWSAFRALQEKQMLLEAMADQCPAEDAAEATRLREEARHIAAHGESLRAMIETLPAAPE